MAKVLNHDICGFVRRVDRFVFELHKSASSSLAAMNEFDKVRLIAYLASARAYLGWVISQPQLDLPESSPREYDIEDIEPFELVDSEDINDLIRMWELLRIELINSQSARHPAGLLAFDQSRATAVLDKIERFKLDYIDVATPLDLPESSPKNAVSGPGKGGI